MLRSLASPTWGARGLFVTLLTDERYDAVFKLPLEPQLLTVIGAAPENKQLLTTQLATSTAMELVHVADGSEELAAASRLTRERSKVLLNALLPRMMGLTEEVQRLRTAVVPWKDDTPPESADKEWIKLTSTYTPEQRAAINAVLDELLAPFDGPVEGLWKSPEIWATAGYGAYALVRQWDPVFCPAGPTSANALVLANALTSVSLAAWVAYVSIVFFSNGILPGPDATQLDAATWVEVRDLSLNFWLISPLLGLPFAPVVHPGLEGIFNLLLAWAAAFAASRAAFRSSMLLTGIAGFPLFPPRITVRP